MTTPSEELEKDALLHILKMLAVSARTAPKTRGIDNIDIVAIEREDEKNKIISKMKELSKSENRPSFERDANSIEKAGAILIIGVKSNACGLNCGYCGYKNCAELTNTNGICAYNSIDLGIAAGSCLDMAGRMHVDNRLMYSIGRSALDLNLFESDIKQALGIPLSVSGKNPFFDRK